MSDTPLRVLWHWTTMGPYHVARMDALARVPGVDLTVVQSAAVDDHEWEPVESTPSFRLITVSPERLTNETTAATASRYRETLLASGADAVVESGYYDAPSRHALMTVARRRPGMISLFWSETTHEDHPRRSWRERAKSHLISRFDGALVAGEAHMKYMVSLGMPPERIANIGTCVDNKHFAEAADAARNRPRPLDLPNRYALYVGRIVPKKNLHTLVRAYATYRARIDDPIDLVIVGAGTDEESLRAFVNSSKIQGIRFLGLRSERELPALYAHADYLVLPSNSEPWGLVVNEAMACALPAIVSNRCGCADELIEDGRTGFRFDPTDARALAQLMERASTLDLDAMGRRARERIADYSPDRYAEQAVEHMRRLASLPDPQRRVRLTARVIGRTIETAERALSRAR
jgi:glycosyltransferase involved in cell wall biosynthesis